MLRKKIKSNFQNLQFSVRLFVIAIIALTFFSLLAINFVNPVVILAIDVLVVFGLLMVRYPMIGLYLMILLFPFVNWQFIWGNVNVPYVDLIAAILLVAMLIRTFMNWSEVEKKKTSEKILMYFPGLFIAIAFFSASALSLFNANDIFFSAKYLLRPILFFYITFVLLPVNLIKSKEDLKKVLRTFLVVGILAAVWGLLAVIFNAENLTLRRAAPFSILGFNPYGGNHNALAEIFVVTIPAAMILYLMTDKIKRQGAYMLAALFMVMILLLTFSRSGWLALLLQMLILFFIRYKSKINRYVVIGIIVFLVLVPTLLYFTVWNQVSWVQVSNANRILLSQISWESFTQHPIIGNGLNEFQRLVGSTFVYQVEFGDPLDSHGFIQKLMTETGLFGLISYISLLGYMIYRIVKSYIVAKSSSHKMMIASLILMVSGIVLFELFSTSYFIAKMWLPIGVCLAGAKALEE